MIIGRRQGIGIRPVDVSIIASWPNRFLRLFFLFVVLYNTSTPANAIAVNFDSKIANVYTSGGTNYAFRAVLVVNPSPTLCPNGFIYVNVSDDNYQARVATILSAQAQGRRVYGTAYTDGSGNCSIGDLGM
jgi:hypothetical protein